MILDCGLVVTVWCVATGVMWMGLSYGDAECVWWQDLVLDCSLMEAEWCATTEVDEAV